MTITQTAATASVGWRELARGLRGDLVLPADDGYELATQMQYSEYDNSGAAAIAHCASVSDVQRCVRYARAAGIPVKVRSGGHAVLGWSTGEGLVVDVYQLKRATVTSDTVHIGPGLEAIDALMALAGLDRQIVTGTCPTVCPGGFLSGGGIGLQTRAYGVGTDRLVSANVVLADGRLVETSADREPDLFWALRGGGGGNFGVVVDFEVRPIGMPSVGFFATTWSWADAPAVLSAWQAWTLAASPRLGSQYMVLLLDAAPGATPAVVVNGVYHGPQAELDAALAEFVAATGTRPESLVSIEASYAEAMRMIYGVGELTQAQSHRVGRNPEATLHRNNMLREQYRYLNRALTAAEVNALITTYDSDRQSGQLRALHLMSLGGVANRISPTATAYVHRSAEFIVGLAAEAVGPEPELPAAVETFAGRAAALLDPIGSGAYVNFPGAVLPDWPTAYYGENYPRLRRVKESYDPDNMFRHARSIGVTG